MRTLMFFCLIFTLGDVFATPIFIDGINEGNLKQIRGVNQPQGGYCAPTVGYMMANYYEYKGY